MACSVDFEKKAIVFITGASKGIGQTIAVELSRQLNQNSVFVLLARSADGLEKTKNAIHEVDKAIMVQTYQVDLSKPDPSKFDEIFQQVLSTINSADISFGMIFHNAGNVGEVKQTTDLNDLKTWREHFDLNLFSTVLLNGVFIKKTRYIAPQLVVVNITSLVGRIPFKNLAMYGAGKASRELFFKVLAAEEPNVIVLNYSPGPVQTDMFQSILETAQDVEVRKSFKEVQESSVLTTEQTVDKLVEILKAGDFKTGDTIDYFDRV